MCRGSSGLERKDGEQKDLSSSPAVGNFSILIKERERESKKEIESGPLLFVCTSHTKSQIRIM
jgi:hypothetical protein